MARSSSTYGFPAENGACPSHPARAWLHSNPAGIRAYEKGGGYVEEGPPIASSVLHDGQLVRRGWLMSIPSTTRWAGPRRSSLGWFSHLGVSTGPWESGPAAVRGHALQEMITSCGRGAGHRGPSADRLRPGGSGAQGRPERGLRGSIGLRGAGHGPFPALGRRTETAGRASGPSRAAVGGWTRTHPAVSCRLTKVVQPLRGGGKRPPATQQA